MKTFKSFLAIFLLAIIVASTLNGCKQKHNVKRIGIVLPIEHQALNEIVAGFTSTLQTLYPHPLEFKIANAQGDMNTQRAIIEQMRDADYAMIVPIGTSTTQMTASLVEQKPVVALAAVYSEQERHVRKSCNVAIVDDEISNVQVMDFIHHVYPNLRTLALVHSAGDKIFPEVAETKLAAKNDNIEVHSFMVTNLAELYTIGQALPSSTQAIFILKDNMIASGIDTLISIAKVRHIPLITSDEATVEKGAAFAIGVHEKQIGEEGAKLATQILQGKSACQLASVKMTHPTVFINQTALPEKSSEQQTIKNVAAQLHLPISLR